MDPRWFINMLATYDLLTALHTSCASETLPSLNPPHREGEGKVDPTLIMYLLVTCQVHPTQSLLHMAYIRDHDHDGGGGDGGCWAVPYVIPLEFSNLSLVVIKICAQVLASLKLLAVPMSSERRSTITSNIVTLVWVTVGLCFAAKVDEKVTQTGKVL